jgi:hypothetical protein
MNDRPAVKSPENPGFKPKMPRACPGLVAMRNPFIRADRGFAVEAVEVLNAVLV